MSADAAPPIRYRAGVYPDGTIETDVLIGYDVQKVVDDAKRAAEPEGWYEIWVQTPAGQDYHSEFVGEYHAQHPVREAVRDVKIYLENFPNA